MKSSMIVTSRGPIVKVLAGAVFLLFCASSVMFVSKHFFGFTRLGGLVWLFDLDAEYNIPTWFSSIMLAAAAALCFLAAMQDLGRKGRWKGLAAFLALISLDEVSMIHDKSIGPLREFFHADGVFYFSWVIVAIPVMMVLAVLYSGFFRQLKPAFRGRILAGIGVYLLGALGLEMVQGPVAIRFGMTSPALHAIAHLEELLEMIGAIIFIDAMLRFLSANEPSSA